MSLKYKCPVCGTSLGYEGLCWKCKAEKERSEALAWTPEEIAARQQMVMRNIKALDDFNDPEYTYFWQLLAYHNAITPEIQRKALVEKVFYPSEIYYKAPEDVCDSLIANLMRTKDSGEAAVLMSCLAMQGSDKALAALLELERSPRPWRKKLYVDPSVYAQGGGWTFDKEGHRIELNFKTCYPMVKGGNSAASPVKIGRMRDDACPHCGGRMFDMLVLDGRDERMKFLGIDGILTASCCPNCVPFCRAGHLTVILWMVARKFYHLNYLTAKKKWKTISKITNTENLPATILFWQKNRYRCFTEAMIVISALSAGLPTGYRIGNTQFARNAASL